MNIKELSKDELELMSYKDISVELIKLDGPTKTADLFKFITKGLGLTKAYFENKIGDFYTMLSTDRRFVLLDDGNWDLKEKYSTDLIKKRSIEDDEDEELDDELEELEELEDIEEDLDDDFDKDENDDEFVAKDEDLKDLVVIDEDELEQD